MSFLYYNSMFRNDVFTIWNYFPQWRFYNMKLFSAMMLLQYHTILHTNGFAIPYYFTHWRFCNTMLFYVLTFLQYHAILHTDVLQYHAILQTDVFGIWCYFPYWRTDTSATGQYPLMLLQWNLSNPTHQGTTEICRIVP